MVVIVPLVLLLGFAILVAVGSFIVALSIQTSHALQTTEDIIRSRIDAETDYFVFVDYEDRWEDDWTREDVVQHFVEKGYKFCDHVGSYGEIRHFIFAKEGFWGAC